MKTILFQSLKYKRVTEIIEDSIRNLILTGALKPGDKLPTEKELSRQFNVSIVTVREALRGLELYGIIKKKRGKDGGVFVSEFDKDVVKKALTVAFSSMQLSAQDIHEVGRPLQMCCVRLAASRINEEELKQINDNIKDCEKRIEKKRYNFNEKDFFYIERKNGDFHRLISLATHNPFLILTVDFVEDYIQSYKENTLNPDIDYSIQQVKDHSVIYNHVMNRDEDSAERAMLSHIEWAANYLLNIRNVKR